MRDGHEQHAQVAAGQRRAATDRDVVGEIRRREDARDDQAAQDRPDDRPRGVPELAPADLDRRSAPGLGSSDSPDLPGSSGSPRGRGPSRALPDDRQLRLRRQR